MQKNFMARNGKDGAARYKALHDALTQQAKDGAAKLTTADKAVLKSDLKSTIAKIVDLESRGRDASHFHDEALMLQRQLNRAGASKATGTKSSTGPKPTGAKTQEVSKSSKGSATHGTAKDRAGAAKMTTSSLLGSPLHSIIPADRLIVDPEINRPYATNPFASPDIRALHTQYGDAQMRAALRNSTPTLLRDSYEKYIGTSGAAKQKGESAAAYKDRLINALAEKAASLPDYPTALRSDWEHYTPTGNRRMTLPDLATQITALQAQLARIK